MSQLTAYNSPLGQTPTTSCFLGLGAGLLCLACQLFAFEMPPPSQRGGPPNERSEFFIIRSTGAIGECAQSVGQTAVVIAPADEMPKWTDKTPMYVLTPGQNIANATFSGAIEHFSSCRTNDIGSANSVYYGILQLDKPIPWETSQVGIAFRNKSDLPVQRGKVQQTAVLPSVQKLLKARLGKGYEIGDWENAVRVFHVSVPGSPTPYLIVSYDLFNSKAYATEGDHAIEVQADVYEDGPNPKFISSTGAGIIDIVDIVVTAKSEIIMLIDWGETYEGGYELRKFKDGIIGESLVQTITSMD